MTNIVFRQGVSHVLKMVGSAIGDERRDICSNLLEATARSGHPADHKAGVRYAAEYILSRHTGQ